MAFLFLFFTVVLSLCVVGLIVLALASILASVRDDWKLKNPNENRVREITDLGHQCRSNPLDLTLFLNRPGRREAAGAFASQSVCGDSSSSLSLAVNIAIRRSASG